MKVSKIQLRRIIREERRRLSEMVPMPNNGGAPPAGPPQPKTKAKRWKTQVTSEYDAGYAAGMNDDPPEEEKSASFDDGYMDALADIEAEEAAAQQPMEGMMRITRKQLRETLKEMRALKEDAIDTELDHLKKNISNDLDHIKDLKDDIKDDHEEEVRAEKEKHRKDEALRRRIRAMIREMHHDEQGYDDREDERLAAEHGGEDEHEQSYKDRRDDAGFEEREDEQHQGSHIEVHHHHHHEALKRRLRRIVRETTSKRRR